MSGLLFDDRFFQYARNGRWGTCASCPRDSQGHCYPEFCDFTTRPDHLLNLDGLVRVRKLDEERRRG